jgi:hypothetical protein
MKVSMLKSQMQLMLVWVIGGAILLLVAWLQILFGHYEDKGQDVIAWLLPSIIPTVSLVVGVWANNTRKKSRSTQKVEKKAYTIVLVVSLFYLIFLGMIFAIQPMVALPPLDVIKNSGLILSPLQGVVSVFLGIFFTQEPKSKS